MTWADTIRMAVHNLWVRRGRSALNLLGIVVGCCILLMADAGIRGVRVELQSMFENSDFVRQIQIYDDHRAGIEVPEEALVVEGQMSDSRRERVRDHLRQRWYADHTEQGHGFNLQELAELEQIPHVELVAPGAHLTGTIMLDGNSYVASINSSFRTPDLMLGDIIAGEPLAIGDTDGMVIDDVLAWQYGYRDDASLQELVGKKVEVLLQRYRSGPFDVSSMIPYGIPIDVSAIEQKLQAVRAIAQLVEDMDSTSLTDEQKAIVQQLVPSSDQNETAVGEDTVVVRRELRIRGVYATQTWSDFRGLLKESSERLSGGLLVDPVVMRSLLVATQDEPHVYGGMVTIDSYQYLGDVTTALTDHGVRCYSALRILERAQQTVGQFGFVVIILGAVILGTTCIGICNTLFVSILQRTPEFGIMKSVGADDRHVRRLMLSEGAVLGAAGGMLSVGISFLLSWCGDWILKAYVESQTGESMNGGLFDFAAVSRALTIALSMLLCVLAGLVPAIRAARMDPVTAMRRL